MISKVLPPAAAVLYDQDFFAWTVETARLIRSGLLSEVDLARVAEEIEDMGKSETRELWSRLTVLIIHLLKWKCQPARRSRGWQDTIAEQRDQLDRLIKNSPSLRRAAGPSLPDVYPNAVRRARIQTGLSFDDFPRTCPFTENQVLDHDFLPE